MERELIHKIEHRIELFTSSKMCTLLLLHALKKTQMRGGLQENPKRSNSNTHRLSLKIVASGDEQFSIEN